MAHFDLEYLLLFGPPENKLELRDGKTPCSFPFRERAEADEHFADWAGTLARWQGVADPPARRGERADWVKEIGRFELEQYRRPIRLEVPSEIEAYHLAYECFFDRGLWPGQPRGWQVGFESPQLHSWIKMNLWRMFRDAQDGGPDGYGIGSVDISLTDRDGVQPDFYFYPGSKKDHMIGDGGYFKGPPMLVMEVMSAFSRAIDRGPRKEVYRRAGVPQLWLIEPLTRTVELHRLSGDEYHLTETATAGRTIKVPELDPLELSVDAIFDVRHDWPEKDEAMGKRNDWAVPKDVVVGLQHLILLGHAERRREIWDNKSPCFLAFGSAQEARHRLERFIVEAARWEDRPAVEPVSVGPDVDTADVGRFHFSRRGHVVRVDVDVDGRLYRSLLEVTADRAAWDWGGA